MNTSRVLLLTYALLLALATGCHEEAERSQRANDSTSRVSRNGALIISREAQAAIGMTVAPVEQRDVPQTMPATGWLAAPPSREIVVKAPTTGFIMPKADADNTLGRAVAKSERLAEIEVFLSPQEQAQLVTAKEDAEKELQQAHDTLKLNEEQLGRAEAGAPMAVAGIRLVELREIVAHARAAEQAARKKLPFLPEGAYEDLHLKAVPIDSPLAGRLIASHVAPRQLVVAGDPLWTIADWSRLWVRVPVFVADLSRIKHEEPAIVILPGQNKVCQAQPIQAPQSIEPTKQTIELVYAIEQNPGDLRPGEAVSVSLPIGQKQMELAIPRSAILWDGMGNNWVYVRASGDAFRRQKIETGQLLGDQVAVQRGLKQGDEVVSTGAEALFGEEFKEQIQVEDKD